MTFCEGGPAGRYRLLDPSLLQPDHIGITLTHHNLAPLDHSFLGPVEPIQHPALVVHGRAGRVLVLRSSAAWQEPAAGSDRLAPGLEDREQPPAPEEIRVASRLIDGGQAGVDQGPMGYVQRADHLVPASGAQPSRYWRTTARRSRARAADRTGRRRVQSGEKALVVPGDGLRQRLVVPRSALPILADRLVVVPQRDAGPGRQLLHGLYEVEMLQLPDEGDDVAGGATSEAVVEPQFHV